MHRHSSRRGPSLGKSFLAGRLRGARSYHRIAGYFSSSILEVAGEKLESMSGKVRKEFDALWGQLDAFPLAHHHPLMTRCFAI